MGRIVNINGKVMSSDNMEPIVDKEGNTVIPTEPSEHVTGVQIWEKGICVGTALYKHVHHARAVAKILNEKYAELRVDHEAKLITYPVY